MIKNIISLSIFLVLCMSAFAQNIKINNTVTSAHQRIEGTKIYMIPPDGFTQVPEVLGLQESGKGNSILVRESAGSYKALVQTFLTENMKIREIKVKSQEKIMLNDTEASFFTLEQKVSRNTFTKYLLFSGDNDFSVLISAVFPKDDNKIGEKIKKSMLSIAYREENEEEPMPRGFRLNFKESGLHWGRTVSGAVIYTADGSTSTNALTDNSFFAGASVMKETNTIAFAKERLQKQIKTPIVIESEKEISIGGLKGYEIKANTSIPEQTITLPPRTKKGKPTTITNPAKSRSLYQVLLFKGETYYILYGSTTQNQTAQMQVFERLANSFELQE